MKNLDEFFMNEAYNEALKAWENGEVPVGSIVVFESKIIARGHNQSILDADVTAHAEIIALRNASKYLKNYRLNECSLYTTLEPCPMCAYSLVLARIKRLVFGAFDPKVGSVESLFSFCEHKSFNHKIEVKSGIMQQKCEDLLKDFFVSKRKFLS